MKKRITCIIFCLIMTLSVLSSCGDGSVSTIQLVDTPMTITIYAITDEKTTEAGIQQAEDAMNAITEYRMDFKPNASNSAQIDLEFFYNGTSRKVFTNTSPYASSEEASGHYFFGTDGGSSGSSTWYIVKSCTITVIEE